jgi:hypothetical protein
MHPTCLFFTYPFTPLYSSRTFSDHHRHDTIVAAWDRTRAACVGVQHAPEWVTRCPKEYVYILDLYSERSCALYVALSSILFYY